MVATKPIPAMKIFQDSSPGQPRARPPTSGRGVLGNISTNAQPIFRQPHSQNSASPLKKPLGGITAQARGSVFHQSFENVAMPPPKISNFMGESPIKKPPFSVFNTSLPNGPSVKKSQSTFMPNYGRAKAAFAADKENYGPPPAMPVKAVKENFGPALSGMKQPIPQQQRERSLVDIENELVGALAPKPANVQKIAPRKALQEAAPIKEKPIKKAPAAPSSPGQVTIPEWDNMPPIIDDGGKPAYSYATLIGMAILRAPGRRLTLAQIYKWISDTFAYYRQTDHGWQNSIRHNLSLNKALVRQERPKDEPGKGSYWTIKPGQEFQFMGGRGAQKRGVATSKKTTGSKKLTSSSPLPPPAKEEVQEPAQDLPSLPPIPTTDATEVPEEQAPVISSDATLTATPSPRVPLSSMGQNMQPIPYLNFAMPSSPPRHHLQSSPPMRAPAHKLLGETPPQLPGPRKRKHSTAMNDSGYISSLESSVLRTTEEERRIKRGRAEEDIARIRRSSTIGESPIMRMSKNLQPRSSAFMTSSPLAGPQFDRAHLAPLTPATTLYPRKVPLSASPNTNLRSLRNKVREMVPSPSRELEVLNDDWDNTFDTFVNVDASPYVQPDLKPDMTNLSPMPYIRGITSYGSPFKKPAARQLNFDSNFLAVPEESFSFFGDNAFLDAADDDFAQSFLDL